jgi:hypothetical protein
MMRSEAKMQLRLRWWRIGLLGLLLVLLRAAPASAQTDTALFELPSNPQALVLRFSESYVSIADPDPGSSLEIHADGRVVVHYPPYMKRAGDYEMHLSAGALRSLVASQLARGVAEFDPVSARKRVREVALERGRAAGSERPELFVAADASISRIELRLRRYTAAGRPSQVDLVKQISWKGLAAHARRYPEIPALEELARAQTELLELMQSTDLVRVR